MKRHLTWLLLAMAITTLPTCGGGNSRSGADASPDPDSGTDDGVDTDTHECGDGDIWDVDCGSECETCDDGNTLGGDYCGSDCGTSGWHTFYGSASGDDQGCSIAIDASGNIYVAGRSSASWNGPAGEAPLQPWSGDGDLFVLKLSAAGDYQWHTFYRDYGGMGPSNAIAVDSDGNVYVSGTPSEDWAGPGGEIPLNEYSGWYGLYVLKLNTDGAYQWHTFYGNGSQNNAGGPIAVDASGDVYVTGYSSSTWTGPGGETPLHELSDDLYGDAHVFKLNANGEYQWHTFYGSDHGDEGHAIALDGAGNLFVAGESQYSWNGPNGEEPRHPGTTTSLWVDVFVLKLSTAGEYQWHTLYGYVGGDECEGIAVDSGGNVYVVGNSEGVWDDAPLPLHGYSEQESAFVLKLTGSGMYGWHTFYGVGYEQSIAIGSGDVIVSGFTWISWNGPEGELPMHAYSGDSDVFVAGFSSAGDYRWHTFYGSPARDGSDAVALGDGIAVAGLAQSTWFGPNGEGPLHEYSGSNDLAVLKLAR